MIRALKVLLIVFGVYGILMGFMLVILPEQAAVSVGVNNPTGYLIYALISLGMCLIVPSVFLIIAARDPVKHINWVKFAIVWGFLGAAGGLYAVLRGVVPFGQVAVQIIMDFIFAVVILALYPFKAAKN